jgi:subtilisin family serine protease
LEFIQREKSAQVDVRPLWVTNKIILRNADLSIVQKIQSRSDILSIAEERMIPLHPMGEAKPLPLTPRADAPQWGVAKILADQVHASNVTGQGIVVAHIDTGVRVTHEALASNHRAEYGWRDPYTNTPNPTDQAGHGTHTMGSIAGTANGIGVAPGATWISCRGCSVSQCTDSALLECGQFMACPTDYLGQNKDCTKAPHLVSNSWGGGQGDSFYDDPIAVWRAAGIIPLFSIGNSGPTCKTANSPGDNLDVIGVGSTTSADRVSSFSSLGPTVNGDRKPDIAAPGSDIVSAGYLGDKRYATMSGTSMSCPHAAGLTALILSQFGELEYDEVKKILEDGAVAHNAAVAQTCGGISNSARPNNHVGHGRVNAVNSVLGRKMH